MKYRCAACINPCMVDVGDEPCPPESCPCDGGIAYWKPVVAENATIDTPTNDIFPPTAAERKTYPIKRGLLDYFPNACAEVAHVSYVGNEQHNAGQPMHWAREKSTDHADCLCRHLIESGTVDSDGLRHTAKLAWRALALLQLEIEAGKGGRIDEVTMV